MKFSSIKEYFYRLQSVCYALLLLPLGLLIVVYFTKSQSESFIVEDEQYVLVLKILFTVIAIAELTIVHLFLKSKFKQIMVLPSLGDRLDKFVSISFIRTAVGITSSLIMLLGFFLTGNNWFIALILIILCIVFFQRPTPSRLCQELQLKGSEKELILNGELK